MSEAVEGKVCSGVAVAANDQIDFGRQNVGFFQRVTRRRIAHREGCFFRPGDAPFANTGAAEDPFIRRLDHFGKIVIGHDFRRNVLAPADDMCVSHTAPLK